MGWPLVLPGPSLRAAPVASLLHNHPVKPNVEIMLAYFENSYGFENAMLAYFKNAAGLF